MGHAKANASHPPPLSHATQQREQKAHHDEHHERKMNDDNKVSSQSVKNCHATQETNSQENIPAAISVHLDCGPFALVATIP
jgi:hypothetical protein